MAHPTPATPRVRIQTEAFDLGLEISQLQAADPRVGAVCSFVGTVRDRNTPPVQPVRCRPWSWSITPA